MVIEQLSDRILELQSIDCGTPEQNNRLDRAMLRLQALRDWCKEVEKLSRDAGISDPWSMTMIEWTGRVRRSVER